MWCSCMWCSYKIRASLLGVVACCDKLWGDVNQVWLKWFLKWLRGKCYPFYLGLNQFYLWHVCFLWTDCCLGLLVSCEKHLTFTYRLLGEVRSYMWKKKENCEIIKLVYLGSKPPRWVGEETRCKSWVILVGIEMPLIAKGQL